MAEPSDAPLEPGTEVDRFEIVALLGEGGMAHVYRVVDLVSGRACALKVLHHPDRRVRMRLERESQAQSVEHENIVRVYEIVEVKGEMALVMELVEGPTLKRFLEQRAPLPLSLVDEIAVGTIEGVAAAHRAGHLHRDLKPANVLMAEVKGRWIPKVTDFGLTKAIRSTGPHPSTQTGMLMGTPGYLSPEQARDAKEVDERTDVFSLGCVLYEVATGLAAFNGTDRLDVLMQASHGRCIPVHSVRPELDDARVRAIMGALAPRPEDRIPDCDTLLRVWRGTQAFALDALRRFDPTTLSTSPRSAEAVRKTFSGAKRPLRQWHTVAVVALALGLASLRRTLPDITPPEIVAVRPPPRARGVRVDEPVVITFNEPMDPETTEPALATNRPAYATWSDDGTQMELHFPMLYAEGRDLGVTPEPYRWTLSTMATDLAGNRLPKSVEAGFTTARRIHWSAGIHANLYGNSTDGGKSRFLFIGAGDAGAAELIGVASWHLPALEVIDVEHAEIVSTVHLVRGDPRRRLGRMRVERIRFKSFPDAFSASVVPGPSSVMEGAEGTFRVGEKLRADITALVAAAHADGDGLIQLRFRFTDAPSKEGARDQVYFRKSETTLHLTYVAK